MSEKPPNEYLASGGLPPGWEVVPNDVPFPLLRTDVQIELKGKFDTFVTLAKIALARMIAIKHKVPEATVTFSVPDIATMVVTRTVLLHNKKYDRTHYGFKLTMSASVMGSTDPAHQEYAGALIETLRFDEGQPTVH
jgi:hypothetical protein